MRHIIMLKNIFISPGTPYPLGSSVQKKTYNFAIFSQHAEQVFLGLFSPRTATPASEYPLIRTGDIWHISLKEVPPGFTYAFRAEGPKTKKLLYNSGVWLADPYAKSIDSPAIWNSSLSSPSVQAHLPSPSPFDWEGIKAPNIQNEELIIYETHVRGFTQHPSSGASSPGTYKAFMEKIPYLKKLGINAVELMPIFEFDETRRTKIPHLPPYKLPNYWGYSPLHFFVPMRRYAAGDPLLEFKTMVRELHRSGILVFLDVVYNHTGEGKEKDYFVHFRGLDNDVYYQVLDTGEYRDYTGCGHTINANHPQVQTLILDSLRYWAEEMHIDGFRFDLGAALTRDPQGVFLPQAPLLDKIIHDPILSQKRLICEAWDAAGLYLIGQFANHGPWHEWNGPYRDRIRRFIKGTNSYTGRFAASLCGSEPIYGASKTPLSSLNFITAHDGFCLRDLVTYQQKHNLENEEKNLDGSNQNDNWNCGTEGPTQDPLIAQLRERQMRNFLLSLFTSQGIPMLLMGDEYGHTRKGNNNPYVQDNEINWFLWDQKNEKIFAFTAALIAFRKKNACFRRTKFLTDQDITWHGHTPHTPNWSSTSRFIAFVQESFYVAFNADYHPADITLPEGLWHVLINTEKNWDEQPLVQREQNNPIAQTFTMQPYSAVLLTLRTQKEYLSKTVDENKNPLV
jgi:isoamylase